MHVDTAVILAGGAGTRLGNITKNIPKALIPVNKKPLLEWVIDWLAKNNVHNLVIGVAYLKEKIMKFFKDGSDYGVKITYSVHTAEGGTAQGFRLAISRYVTDETFFALNGDQITDLNLKDVVRRHCKKKPLATIVTVHPSCPFGQMKVTDDGYAERFVEKPKCISLCNSGIYVFDRRILPFIPERGDIEKTTFSMLAKDKKLLTYSYDRLFLTVNTLKDLMEAERMLGSELH